MTPAALAVARLRAAHAAACDGLRRSGCLARADVPHSLEVLAVARRGGLVCSQRELVAALAALALPLADADPPPVARARRAA